MNICSNWFNAKIILKRNIYVEIDSYLESGNCILLIQINMKSIKTWFSL